MHRLYPASTAITRDRVETRDGQYQLPIAVYGNPDGLPIVCLHGGPGAGTSPHMHRFFDATRFRILCFDQRGSGDSTPLGGLTENTTARLLDDIEHLTAHVGFKRFALFGGSWGATLALLYAQHHPEQTLGLILRGLFLASHADIDWLYFEARDGYPRAWQDFTAPIGGDASSADAVFAGYERVLNSPDPFLRKRAARAWNLWEYRLSICDESAKPKGDMTLAQEYAMARIEHHYISQSCFIDADALLNQMSELQDIPGYLVHGVLDDVCRVSNAEALKAHWPTLHLDILPNASHSAFSDETSASLCEATAQLASRYGH